MPKANVLNRKLITWGCRSSMRRRRRWSSGWWRAWTSIFFATITSIKLSLGRGRFLVTLLQRLSLDIETCRHYKKQEWVSLLGMFLEKIYSFKNMLTCCTCSMNSGRPRERARHKKDWREGPETWKCFSLKHLGTLLKLVSNLILHWNPEEQVFKNLICMYFKVHTYYIILYSKKATKYVEIFKLLSNF